jgi:hypothetical protein
VSPLPGLNHCVLQDPVPDGGYTFCPGFPAGSNSTLLR